MRALLTKCAAGVLSASLILHTVPCLAQSKPTPMPLAFGAGFDALGEKVEVHPSNPAENAIDGDFSTVFSTGVDAVRGELGIYLFNKRPVNTIRIYEPFETIRSYRLQWSNTGSDWKDILASTNPIGANGRTFSFKRVDARFFRIKVDSADGGFQISEFQISFETKKDLKEAQALLTTADRYLQADGSGGILYRMDLLEQLRQAKQNQIAAMNNPLFVQYQLEEVMANTQQIINQLDNTAQTSDTAFEILKGNMKEILLENRTTYNSSSATALENTMIKDGGSTLWESIGSAQNAISQKASGLVTSSYQNLLTMAYAYAVPASSRYKDANLLSSIRYGLDILHTYWYNENILPYGNWWDFEIGAPLRFTELLILIWDELSPVEQLNYAQSLDAYRKEDYVTSSTGANRVHIALCDSRMGALTKNLQQVQRARQAIDIEIAYKDGNNIASKDGFYLDGSFIQHEAIAYNGSYGVELIRYLMTYIREVSESPWALTSKQMDIIYNWYKNGFMPLMYAGAMMDMVNGRAIVRKNNDKSRGYAAINAIVDFADLLEDEQRKIELLSFVKRMLTDDTFYDWRTKAGVRTRSVMNDSSIPLAQPMVKAHSYHNMDRVVQHRPGYAFGVSMFSSRIRAFEQTNGENLQGWYTGSGMTYLYNKDDGHYTDDYWWTVDMYRLSGTTLTKALRSTKRWEGEFLSKYDFVGSLSDGTYAAAAMELEQWKSDLTARKSWFMFDNEIVCIGSNISAQEDANEVVTIVENRRLEKTKGENAFMVNFIQQPTISPWSAAFDSVTTAFLKGTASSEADIGYYFPIPTALLAQRTHSSKLPLEVSSGNTQTTPAENYFLSMEILHGTKPNQAEYGYVILPGISPVQLEGYANSPDVEIIAQTPALHAVREKTLGITAIALFENQLTQVQDITINKAALLMVRDDGSFVVSDPSRKQGTVTITFPEKIAFSSNNPRVVIDMQEDKTIVKVNLTGMEGKEIEVTK